MISNKSLNMLSMSHKSSSRSLCYILVLSVLVLLACSCLVVEAQPMSPLLSEANLEQIRQMQQPLPSMTNYWRPRRSLASGRWGLRPGKRSSADFGSYNSFDAQEVPQMYLVLARN
uniref:Uncharacterized protein n=1 Tax=Ditylenchus dipsaci TaxID=166011 RepID=A0A915DP93_9BILA